MVTSTQRGRWFGRYSPDSPTRCSWIALAKTRSQFDSPMKQLARQEKSTATSPANALIGIAGVHHVVSELSRRGLIALPTTRNVAGYDVIVLTPDGTKHANLQVKTSLKMVFRQRFTAQVFVNFLRRLVRLNRKRRKKIFLIADGHPDSRRPRAVQNYFREPQVQYAAR